MIIKFSITETRRRGGRHFLENSLCLPFSMVKMAILCGVLLFSGCSKRERSDPNADEWADIQALADDAVMVQEVGLTEGSSVPQIGTPVPAGEFSPFIQRLAEIKMIERKAGETLLTGEKLVFDQDQRFVRLDNDVVVVDDQGTLQTQSLIGRFTVSNELDVVEAKGEVTLVSSNRTATAMEAIYNYQSGFVELQGKAAAVDGGNRLSGERIQLWIKGDRKMICEPNALLEVSADAGLTIDGIGTNSGEHTEIRADSVVYDESKRVAELVGNVRVRDSRAAMNCGLVRLFLKDNNEIDWIEASSEVIIQSDDRKALADRATYHADEGKFTLEGEPKLKQGPNVMTGDRITFWHETRRMVCEPNARALLYLDEETKAKFLKDLDE